MKRKHYFKSSEEHSCGLDCLRMLLADLSGDPDYVFLLPEKKGPVSLEELIEAAGNEGLTLEGLVVDQRDQLRENKEFPLLLVLNGEEEKHMVILDSIRGPVAFIRDPGSGRKAVSLKKLSAAWSGEFLRVEAYDGHGYSRPVPEVLRAGGRTFSLILTLLSQIALLLGFYFIREDGNFLVPLLSLLVFAFCEIASRVYSVRSLRNFDHEYLGRLSISEERSEDYAIYQRFKGLYFGAPVSLLTSLLSGGLLALLYCLNDPTFVLPLSLLLIVLFLDSFVVSPKLLKKREALERKEKAALSQEGASLEEVSEEGHKVGTALLYRKLVLLVSEGIFALLSTVISGNMSLNYFLLLFLSLYALGTTLGSSLSLLSTYDDRKAAVTLFRRKFLGPVGEVEW